MVSLLTWAGISESFRSDIGVDKLEEWINLQGGDGVQLGEFVIKLLLYVDGLVLISKSTHGLHMHLYSLEHFCKAVGIQVNTSKTKIMIFSNKRK